MVIKVRQTLEGKRIGVLGKGGSGKSTAVVLLAKALRRRGYEVCILDADSTNVGLHRALGLEEPPVSLIDYFGGMVFSGGLVTCPVDDPTPLRGGVISLDELPADFYARTAEGIYLLAGGKMGEQGPGAGCDGPISKITRDLRIRARGDGPVTLVDFKAGFEDSARGVITSLDWAIEIVDPTTAAIQMAVNLKEMVDQIKAGTTPATEHLESPLLVELARRIFREAQIKGVLVVLNRVTDVAVESYMRQKLAERGIEPIGIIHEDPSIAIAWLKGTPIEAARARGEAEHIVEALEDAEEASTAFVG